MALKEGKITPTFNINGSCSNDFPIKRGPFEFITPPEAPVFRPTLEEFPDPLAYIDSIRHIAEKSGICKIIPPANWQPPFAVDVDKLTFTPRIQRLNELEAKTRIKLNFLDQIAKFWELQGSSLKIPMVEKRALDLYTLHSLVKNDGGFTTVTDEKKWAHIAVCMGYPLEHGVDSILKRHYEKILYPFELYTNDKKIKKLIKMETESKSSKSSKSKTLNVQPKRRGRPRTKPIETKEVYETRSRNSTTTKENNHTEQEYICRTCNGDENDEQMLLCDGCNEGYHTFCLIPPLVEIPKGDWFCPKCVIAEVSKPSQAFGFEQAQKEYNLQQFGEMADTFKTEYFQTPAHLVPTSTVEKEFWRIVSSIDEDVVVEYGADLHTMDHGSGFPTKHSLNLLPADKEYADSGWNLNNLPVLQGSVLRHIKDDISGMSVPWMYVGMCFAAFCWHNEDHWTYSINYLHWGEPKTWYGVPGAKAEIFEETMKLTAPELFHNQPDLLHQLVTIMNPNTLMNAKVPVCRTDQNAGEFVITFPRAYHAGFNQGYNFAEAVNFAPADWVAMGRLCVMHYSQLCRYCVFSHDELICKMATHAEELDITVAAATYNDLLIMVEAEKKLRKSLLEWGVTKVERKLFENIPDDERQCELCKTTCYMSAVMCKCSTEVLVCLRHYTSLCKCDSTNYTLLYRYTLDELLPLLHNLKQQAESFDMWVDKVTDILSKKTTDVVTYSQLKALYAEGKENNFPKSDVIHTLSEVIEDAEKCVSIIKKLDQTKHKISLQELQLFYEEIGTLACSIDEQIIVKDLLDESKRIETKIQHLVDIELDKCQKSEIENLIESCNKLVVELPSLQTLKIKQKQLEWIDNVYKIRKDTSGIVNINTLKELLRVGLNFPKVLLVDNMIIEIETLVSKAEDWEKRAQNLIKNNGSINEAEDLIKEAIDIDVYLPTENILVDNINSANEWFKDLEKINSYEFYPYLKTIENIIEKSKDIIFKLEEVDKLQSYISEANVWKDNTAKIFLKENEINLAEALSPRVQNADDTIQLSDDMDPTDVVSMFKNAADREIEMIKNIRKINQEKSLDPESQNKFCICNNGVYGVMMECDLCKDWFHNCCLELPELATCLGKDVKENAVKSGLKESKFLCTGCLRTKRPRLNTILGLLKSLQVLHNRLVEGEALQYLTERVVNWQDRAEKLLQNSEVADALAKINSCRKMPKVRSRRIKKTSGNNVNYNIVINETIRHQIEELAMEGNLLEVSLEENDQLWSILFLSRDMEKNPVIIDADALNKKPKIDVKNRKGSKRRSEEVVNQAKDVNKCSYKKIKSKEINPKTWATDEDVINISDDDDDEASNDIMCVAMKCLHRSGDEINWIQCDGGCDQWFHMACLGLSSSDINEDEDYICSACSLKK